MYLIVIAWAYVTLMMAVAEATSTTGTVLGAIITFALYGLLPMSILVYILGTPSRKRAIKAREAAEQAAHDAAQEQARAHAATAAPGTEGASPLPDAGGEPSAALTPGAAMAVRKEP
jgi:membrane protein implicated in regulation of membrane protease activity